MPESKRDKNIDEIRHSLAHLLAAAVLEKFPNAKLGVGPVIEDGFYYDFKLPRSLTPEDLGEIEARMKFHIKQNLKMVGKKISPTEAKKLFKDQPFKLELIKDFVREKSPLSVYRTGAIFTDLCRGGHVKSTGDINPRAFKLDRLAGAYWKGSEKRPQLQRVYGLAFASEKQLKDYLKIRERAEQRDHRKIGRDLDLYLFHDLIGPGLPLYTPKGGVVVHEIESFMRQMQNEMGYGHVYTPHLAKEDLFKTSGHLQWFKDSMYPPAHFEGEGDYYAKPMNCPFHVQIYKSKTRSYRDLPIRYAEFGTVYRYEKSGEITGLLRTRGFTQDDAHIFCSEDQVVGEFVNVLNFAERLLDGLGLKNRRYRLSLRGEGTSAKKYAGNASQWRKATQYIRTALKKKGFTNYVEAKGEAAFYGPKLDVIFEDSLGREWQISTIQVDFLLPERFKLSYINPQGKEEHPFMIHRAPLGSRERIMALLIEHYMGAFPLWLAPVQTQIIAVSHKYQVYAQKINKVLKEGGIRSELTEPDETLGKRIREGEIQKIPYLIIVGEKEQKAGTIAVRRRGKGDVGNQTVANFIRTITEEILRKK
ncbi:MAG: threonine--tRNA ligase [Candidatus Colwellbacteria bacterium RBG_13_48_8]|uniref:Threonine--tRNA ligase n=1 Tax=Candidatus Colwellbacteria bacterium RBG_13_48_8 TaxID=1797685 RepID=A0A1G1YXX7_9BACT|nr:MAG: threonine--tRNA ligase [Candidatus Colwellbacteria bacterium RBG_13_48_8]